MSMRIARHFLCLTSNAIKRRGFATLFVAAIAFSWPIQARPQTSEQASLPILQMRVLRGLPSNTVAIIAERTFPLAPSINDALIEFRDGQPYIACLSRDTGKGCESPPGLHFSMRVDIEKQANNPPVLRYRLQLPIQAQGVQPINIKLLSDSAMLLWSGSDIDSGVGYAIFIHVEQGSAKAGSPWGSLAAQGDVALSARPN